jgi:hypothetical protein
MSSLDTTEPTFAPWFLHSEDNEMSTWTSVMFNHAKERTTPQAHAPNPIVCREVHCGLNERVVGLTENYPTLVTAWSGVSSGVSAFCDSLLLAAFRCTGFDSQALVFAG